MRIALNAVAEKQPVSVWDLTYSRPSDRDLQLDVHLPAGRGPWPVIVWIPGGGWRTHSRLWTPYHFAHRWGFAVVGIDYRTTAEAIAPANVHDCKAALRWVRDHAGEYGFDITRLGVWGSSAGGHLAAMLGMSVGVRALEGVDDPGVPVKAFVDFCGPSDLARIGQPAMKALSPRLYEVTAALLGGPVEDRGELAKLVSPLTYVSRNTPPALIVHGVDDATVPLIESSSLYDAMREAGANVQYTALPGIGHGWGGIHTDEQVLAFFRRHLV
jgi:acetyl esterase/lipase